MFGGEIGVIKLGHFDHRSIEPRSLPCTITVSLGRTGSDAQKIAGAAVAAGACAAVASNVIAASTALAK